MPEAAERIKIENSELPTPRSLRSVRNEISSVSSDYDDTDSVWYGHASYDQFDIEDLLKYHSYIAIQSQKLKKDEFDIWERKMILEDIYYLGVYVLSWTFMYYTKTEEGRVILRPWIFNRCWEVQNSPDYHVDIWAREHFKSTIITVL